MADQGRCYVCHYELFRWGAEAPYQWMVETENVYEPPEIEWTCGDKACRNAMRVLYGQRVIREDPWEQTLWHSAMLDWEETANVETAQECSVISRMIERRK